MKKEPDAKPLVAAIQAARPFSSARRPTPRHSHLAGMIQRAIDDEVEAGISRADLDLLPPRVRNPRLRKRLEDRKLIAERDQVSDRAFRRYFTGR